MRLRRADERQRSLSSQRAGRIDPNPHQIDAVVFALQRIPQGGCILADEVGLGKTIEAGLVIAQKLAEGARRILLITPKPLLGQWREELASLFGIEAREAGVGGFDGPGVVLAGRELAGSDRGAEAIAAGEPFDLCVIDEAHEIFASIHRRFDRHGRWRTEGTQARIAARVRSALRGTPVLLLTATPIQNSLSELWGIVQYVEPTGTLLGDLGTFRAVFCGSDDRVLREGQGEELRARIAQICQRTLRRQAQEFMREPFVDRRTQLFEYAMTDEERALYDDVGDYLMAPNLCAFRGGQRRLLLLGFRRRMASSTRALAVSLRRVQARLQRMCLPQHEDDRTIDMFADDLEDDDLREDDEPHEQTDAPAAASSQIRGELARVTALADRAEALPHDSKAQALVRALRLALSRPDGSGKAVVFTESLTTQEYLRDLLVESGVVAAADVTLFRGDNTGPRADEALARWQRDKGDAIPPHSRPTRDVAVRMALVHEFETRTRVLVSTEAGAKGLNLQFCDTLVNYDLPWNPQRIEQRIGRCHRYGQKRGVLVINFLARDNEADRLVLDILTRKLDLFGTVIGASDAVLHEPGTRTPETLAGALGLEFEARLAKIYERARNIDEIKAELVKMRDEVGEARRELEVTYQRTASVIATRFDDSVRNAFREIEGGIDDGLADLDRRLEQVVGDYLDAIGVPHRRGAELFRSRFTIPAHEALPERLRGGTTLVVGAVDRAEGGEPLHLGHPIVAAALAEARAATTQPFTVRVAARGSLSPLTGTRGRLAVASVGYDGFEPVVHLLPVALVEGRAEALSAELAEAIVLADLADGDPVQAAVSDADLDDAVEEALFVDQGEVEAIEQTRFEEAIERLERHMEDRVLVERQRRTEIEMRRQAAVRTRDAAVGAEARTRAEAALAGIDEELADVQTAIDRLLRRDDERYRVWRQKAHERRYAAPRPERILEVEFVIA